MTVGNRTRAREAVGHFQSISFYYRCVYSLREEGEEVRKEAAQSIRSDSINRASTPTRCRSHRNSPSLIELSTELNRDRCGESSSRWPKQRVILRSTECQVRGKRSRRRFRIWKDSLELSGYRGLLNASLVIVLRRSNDNLRLHRYLSTHSCNHCRR